MKSSSAEPPDGYRESIALGLEGVRRLSGRAIAGSPASPELLRDLRGDLDRASAIVIGAGAGLSASAGLTYSGERFERYFFDFARQYGIRDIYSGGFYPFPDDETRWAWWARHIYYNRYVDPPAPVYDELLDLVRDRDYFVITTNVDHQFQRAGFDPDRLFATQGDYGLFQSASPGSGETWENRDWTMRAMEAQGFVRDAEGAYQPPEDGRLRARLPRDLIPASPDGSPVAANLRADDTFVEDAEWRAASANYAEFLRRHQRGPVVYLELGVGANTPVIIKYPFWAMTEANPDAVYACLNRGEAFCPAEIRDRSVCLDGDIGVLLTQLRALPPE